MSGATQQLVTWCCDMTSGCVVIMFWKQTGELLLRFLHASPAKHLLSTI